MLKHYGGNTVDGCAVRKYDYGTKAFSTVYIYSGGSLDSFKEGQGVQDCVILVISGMRSWPCLASQLRRYQLPEFSSELGGLSPIVVYPGACLPAVSLQGIGTLS